MTEKGGERNIDQSQDMLKIILQPPVLQNEANVEVLSTCIHYN